MNLKMDTMFNFYIYGLYCILGYLVHHMPPRNVGIAILPYCDLSALSQGTEGKKPGAFRSIHPTVTPNKGKLSSLSRNITQLHQILMHTEALRGIT